jgi:predicted O-methyltransferase YrrM
MLKALKSVKEVAQTEGIISVVRKSYIYLSAYINRAIYFPYIFLKVKNGKIETTKQALNFVFEGKTDLIKPVQIRKEIAGLLKALEKLKPKYILEIGVAQGGNMFLFSRIATKDAKIIGLDWGRRGLLWRMPLFKSFAMKNQKIELIHGDSHQKKTLEEIEKSLEGNKVDFLFIDGDHTYEGVKKDFEMYNHLVRKGGLIAFHDIIPFTASSFPCKVNLFWDEIKKKHKYKEIIHNRQGGWGGIGIIVKK